MNDIETRLNNFSQNLSQILGTAVEVHVGDGSNIDPHSIFVRAVGPEAHVGPDDVPGSLEFINNDGTFMGNPFIGDPFMANPNININNPLTPQNVSNICQYLINELNFHQNQLQNNFGIDHDLFPNTIARLNFIHNHIAQHGTIPNHAQFPAIQPHNQVNVNNNQANVGNNQGQGQGLN